VTWRLIHIHYAAYSGVAIGKNMAKHENMVARKNILDFGVVVFDFK